METQPQRISLTPQDTFHLGPHSGLQVNQKGKICFAGEGLRWYHMRFPVNGVDTPLLGGEDGRPYYEAHWPAVIAMEAGKHAGKRAVLKLIEQGHGDWLGPPNPQGSRGILAFAALGNAFHAQIPDRDLIRALSEDAKYRHMVERGQNLLEMALKMRLFGVAEALWQQGHRFSEGALSSGAMVLALSMPNVVGEGASLADIIARLAGPRPIKRKNYDDLDFDRKESAWMESGWQALVKSTQHWLKRLDECQTRWTGRHRLREESHGQVRDVELPWAATIFMFPMRDYEGRRGQSTIPIYASWQESWRQAWTDYLDRLPGEMLNEPTCQLGERKLSLVELLREQGQGELASHMECRALDATVAPAATQHRMARL